MSSNLLSPLGRVLAFLGFLVLSMLVPVGLAQAQAQNKAKPDLRRAENLVRSGKAAEAWQLLSPYEFELAGREDFDYLLGVAALDSGLAGRATLVFERVLVVNPEHAAARLDMARAYYALGDMARARKEFEDVLERKDTPEAARVTIERYLAAIDERGPDHRTLLAGYAELGAGRDSNVSGATASSAIYVPLFNTALRLGANSRKAADSFVALGGGAELTHALGGGISFIAGLDYRERAYRDWDIYDSRSLDYRAGLQATGERASARVILGRNDYALDHDAYRRIGSFGLELRHAFDSRTQFVGFAQVSEIKYLQDSAASHSSDLSLAGFGVVRSMEGSGNPVLFASAYAGEDIATRGRSDGDSRLQGVRGGYQRALRDDLDLVATLAVQRSRFNTFNPLFQDTRKDLQYDLGLGFTWRFQRDWQLTPKLNYTRSDSNLQIYDYSRSELSLTLRREFR